MTKKRQNVELDEATRLVVDRLRDRMGASSRSETVRRLARFVWKVSAPGNRLIVRDEDGGERDVSL